MPSISKTIGRTRRRWFGVTTAGLAVTTLLVGLMVVTSGAVVSGSPSNFESNDGNMTLEANNNTDWNCFTNLVGKHLSENGQTTCGVSGVHFSSPTGGSAAVEFPATGAGTTSDPSWVPGQKMDQGTCIPGTTSKSPGKDTFTQVASYNEVATSGAASGDTFLYGGTERQTANGDASENIELSQVSPANAPTSAHCSSTTVIFRTQGDKLIALNYTNGGANLAAPTILTWVTSTAGFTKNNVTYAGTCLVGSDKPPCWSSTTIQRVARYL